MYTLENASPPVKRHYAIPGSQRCIQCHMGSATADFALGFLPLQIARRATNTGGSYEPTGDDELTQLQRLIDYGIITGVTSPADILPLEQAEGTRAPAKRPRAAGLQAVHGRQLRPLPQPAGLPFLEEPAAQGCAELPCLRPWGRYIQFSPRPLQPQASASAALNTDVPVPYLTPSLREYPVGPQTTDTWSTK